MGESGFKVAILDVDDRVEGVALEVVLQQVEQAVFRVVALVVVVHRQAAVQVAVVPDALFDILADEVIVAEELGVGDEFDEGACIVAGQGGEAAVVGQLAFAEFGDAGFAVAYRLHLEVGREGVDGFGTHAVQTHRLLEHLAVVLGTGVELAHGLHQFAQRDAAAVVADAHPPFGEVYLHLNLLAEARRELVDGIVYHLLDEHIDAVVVARAVAQLADVHTRAQPDMFHVLQVDDGVVVIVNVSRCQYISLFHFPVFPVSRLHFQDFRHGRGSFIVQSSIQK